MKPIKLKPQTNLEREVVALIQSNNEDEGPESLAKWLKDLESHGCISGMVSGLVYYSETEAFYKRHKDGINKILAELLEDTGESPQFLFKNWKGSDPLALECINQNTLAWFGFEESARVMRERAESVEAEERD
jgi:hypothetical protein